MTRQLVITGFQPFPGVAENPTEVLVRSLDSCGDPVLQRAEAVIVPTRYGDAPAALRSVLASPPRVLIMTGFSARAAGLVLESRASNACTAALPDARGAMPPESADPLHHLPARCDIDDLCAAVESAGLACAPSDDAGGYVCNHLYYHALAALDESGADTRALFVHIPALAGSALAATSAAALELADLQRGLGVLAGELLR
ncbi:hypothetical protein [Croceicoccus marinus]|nr:hypothetical protein [Croceicoccus marinus]